MFRQGVITTFYVKFSLHSLGGNRAYPGSNSRGVITQVENQKIKNKNAPKEGAPVNENCNRLP